MKKSRYAALFLAAVLSVSAFGSCNRHKPSTNIDDISIADVTTVPVAQNKIPADMGQSVTVNDTTFTLNSVISPENINENGQRYVFFDVTIKNNTDTTYSLSTLNNFYIILNGSTNVYSDVRTQLYAMQHFKDDAYFSDPFDIPAQSEFKGIVGGFLLDQNTTDFSVGFFPTKDTPTAKGDVIMIDVKSDSIVAPDASLLK